MKERTGFSHIFAVAAYGESPYLDGLLSSLKNQSLKSEIILCSSTDNSFLRELSGKYKIPLLIREGEPGLRDDWNFAYEEGRRRALLVTIAHQDDLYYPAYSSELRKAYEAYEDMSLFCCRYDTVNRDGRKITGISELVKRILRLKLRWRSRADRTSVKLSALRWGNGIGCPSCSYNSEICGSPLFQNDYHFIIDWDTLIRLARLPGRFICVEKPLMAYRVHEGAETMKQIESHNREREEELEFRALHGPIMARLIMYFYRRSYGAYRRAE